MVINALSDGAPHVPYRDSKLTMLLMDALGGNSKTTLIICCNPEYDHSPETLSTLRFGERAKRIKTNAKVNEELSAAELKVLLQNAKNQLSALVKVMNKTLIGISDAVTVGSVDTLLPLIDMLKKYISRVESSGAVDGASESQMLNNSNNNNNNNESSELSTQSLEDNRMESSQIHRTTSSTPEAHEESGRQTPLLSRAKQLQDADGTPMNMASVAEEISELKGKLSTLEEEIEMEKLR